jgi:hypothetical protein
MEARFHAVLAKAFPNQKTRENYASRLNALLKNLEEPRLLDILQNPERFYPKIQAAYPSITTRKNVLTAMMTLFREDEELSKDTATQTKWKRLHEDLHRHQDAKIKRSEPADKQIAKYTSFEEIEAQYETLKKSSPHSTNRKSFQYLLMSILVHLRPKRADLGNVAIFRDRDPNRSDINYVVLRSTGSSFLAMNLYKTSKHHQTVEEDLPEGLVRDIEQSLARWPRGYLFVKEDGEPMSNNTYSRFVMRTFEELFGRATGVSLLRHIYITEKLDFDDMTLEEQEEEARLMLHTTGLQRRYKWPKKVLCPKLCSTYKGPTRETKRAPRASGTRRSRRRVTSRTS